MFGSSFHWDVRNDPSVSFKDWICLKIQVLKGLGKDGDERISCFFYHLWAIWLSRNSFMFDGRRIDPISSLHNANRMFSEFWTSTQTTDYQQLASIALSSTAKRWSPPPANVLKFNSDAAVDIESSRAAVAVVVRDSSGALLTGTTRNFFCCSVVHAEAVALLEASRLAVSLDVRQAIFEGEDPPWQILSVMDNMKPIIDNAPNFSFHWIPRSLNSVADWVARASLKCSLPPT